MTQVKNPKKGLFLTSVLLLAMLVFVLDMSIGVVSLFFSSITETIASLFGTTNTTSVLSSVLQIASAAVGLFSCISLWKLQKKGLYFFLLAVAISLTANFLAWGFINYFLIAIYGVWTLIILLNFKKLT